MHADKDDNPRKRPPTKVAKPEGSRKHVTYDEFKRIRAAALELGRHGLRDSTMIMVAFYHGLRSTELVGLLWEQVNLYEETVFIVRAKRGSDATHPIPSDELKALRKLAKLTGQKGHVFQSERGGPVTTSAFAKIAARAGVMAEMQMRVGTHMFRHGCGYHYANKGKDTRSLQGFLGHKNIQHTVLYTALAKDRFKEFKPD
jgi:type 1 fimbriae regulatory protein FimB